MADITMCRKDDCPLKNSCHRYLATPNLYRQSYFINHPWDDKELKCNFYVRDTSNDSKKLD